MDYIRKINTGVPPGLGGTFDFFLGGGAGGAVSITGKAVESNFPLYLVHSTVHGLLYRTILFAQPAASPQTKNRKIKRRNA